MRFSTIMTMMVMMRSRRSRRSRSTRRSRIMSGCCREASGRPTWISASSRSFASAAFMAAKFSTASASFDLPVSAWRAPHIESPILAHRPTSQPSSFEYPWQPFDSIPTDRPTDHLVAHSIQPGPSTHGIKVKHSHRCSSPCCKLQSSPPLLAIRGPSVVSSSNRPLHHSNHFNRLSPVNVTLSLLLFISPG